ncbi:MAG: hypothetical protein ACUVX8_14125 [Candidatus Zipacnadales bacterium]
MSVAEQEPLASFKTRLDKLVSSVTRSREQRIAYGNLRHEYSYWEVDGQCSTNIALIYETPGGSTVQINVTYENGQFSYLTPDGADRVTTSDPNLPLHMIAQEIRSIPERRLQRLHRQIESWYEEGMEQSAVFAEMNKLLQSDFLGGSITQRELKLGIMHAIELRHRLSSRS